MQEDNEYSPDSKRPRAMDLRLELDKLDTMISELKVLFEQYFLGILPLAPDKPHTELKLFIRRLRKAPFKNSETIFRLKSIENRYNTLATYWQRVMREREDGTYHRDVFKANLRERRSHEEAVAATKQGKAEKGLSSLFESYKEALLRQTGSAHNLDFDAFKSSLMQRAKDLKEKTGAKHVAFKIVVKNGSVVVQAKAK